MIKFWFDLFGFDLRHGFIFPSVGAAIGSIAGGIIGADAAGDAADAQLKSSREAVAEQKRQYDLNRQDLAPYREVGTAGLYKLANLLGIDTGQGTGATPGTSAFTPLSYADWAKTQGNTYTTTPTPRTGHQSMGGYVIDTWNGPGQTVAGSGATQAGYQKYLAANPARSATPAYGGTHDASFGSLLKKFDANDLANDLVYQNGLQFGLDQGTQAIENRARASGSSDSGAVLKELLRYGNDYATTKTNDAYNRYTNDNTNIYNKLAGITGTGQNAVNQGVQAGQTSANNITNLLTDQGNARAAGIIGGANAWSGALGGIANQNWGNIFGNKSGSGSDYGLYGGPTQYQF